MADRASLESDAYMQKLRREALASLAWLSEIMEDGDMRGTVVNEVRITSPRATGRDYRLTLKGTDEDGRPVLAFVNGVDTQELLRNARALQGTDGLRWRDDIPWAERHQAK